MVVVALNDDPVTVNATADGEETFQQTVNGKLEFAVAHLGYQPEKDPALRDNHEGSVWEAEQYLKDKSSEK